MSRDPLFLVGGCPRSGTTLVRNLIAAHPAVAVPPESQFMLGVLRQLLATGGESDLPRAWKMMREHPSYASWELASSWVAAEVAANPPASYADLVRALFAAYARSQGKEHGADKAPEHALRFILLASLFPHSRMVSVIRDPREVAMSAAVQWSTRGGMAEPAVVWRNHARGARLASAELGSSRFHELRYERLVADPTAELERLCAFGDIPFHVDMTAVAGAKATSGQLHSSLPVGVVTRRWRDEMSAQDVAVVEVLAGEEMERAGYPPISSRHARLRARGEIARFRATNRMKRRVRERWSPALPPLPERLAPPRGAVTRLAVADVESPPSTATPGWGG